MPFENLTILGVLSHIVDIFLVWYVIYKLIMFIRGTKAVQLLTGIFVIILVWILSGVLNLNTLNMLMETVMTWGFLAIIIIFQPELRRALEQLGRGKFFARSGIHEEEEQKQRLDAIINAVNYMAKRRIGALISIEKETGMGDYIETGIPLHSKLTHELLINIFIPNTPLHDGAVIIQKTQIAAAACYLPLSESPFISKELGTRHRAALGISEVTDCLTIVVSEETGGISVTKNGELLRDLSLEQLQTVLEKELTDDNKAKQSSSSIWKRREKTKNG
ncbi:diadenylate cyclase CdaA [Lederbergia wuyishanensis]|uniref:Diadenylate cyclase n=1 Tax=Lederbergia wuyishanensis TaxID=1347903 RepID=A0ABU0D5Z1_9BACI|nr:diadenylate cyclase CdaA [Lederbergia wuyishanensis]MCJ8008741.1 diadenylate cyclase CdaA [Lederbergia wuyishanensis]MDQ0343837.1 diadenylate cyclase [Lederbergia wuyishanensis]